MIYEYYVLYAFLEHYNLSVFCLEMFNKNILYILSQSIAITYLQVVAIK